MIIRPATPADWTQMWAIFQAVVATETTYVFAPNTSEDDARAYFLSPDLMSFVAYDDDDGVVGMYRMVPNRRDLGSHVANASYMVDPRCQGRRIGESLGRHSLREAKRAGFVSMQFNFVISTNTAAVALWKKLGFTIVGTTPRGFRHRDLGFVDAFSMYRALDDISPE